MNPNIGNPQESDSVHLPGTAAETPGQEQQERPWTAAQFAADAAISGLIAITLAIAFLR